MKYAAKSVRYPTAAFNKRITGNVLVSLRLDDAHKITDLKVINGIGSGCDEEVIRALKSYPGTISQKPGTYRFVTSFALIEDSGSKSHYPKQIADDVAGSKNFIGQVIVAGYVAKLFKKLPPPPPAPPAKKLGEVKFPPPSMVVKPDKSAAIKEIPITSGSQDDNSIKDLYDYLKQSIRYPKQARDTKKEGRVIVTFNVNGKKLENIKIVRGIDTEIDGEVVKALSSFNKPLAISSDYKYSLPIFFHIESDSKKQRAVVEAEYPLVAYNYPKGTNLSLNAIVVTYNAE
jgi:TonB family protein